MTFDPINTPLDHGITRLEASAGTGKTYTLTDLFLRLLVEHKVPATEILVVTYTKAATAELRDRIRRRLREALVVLKNPTADEKLAQALGKWAGTDTREASVVDSVQKALELFDEVSIDTIHAFCQRTLQDRAFESGILFDEELIPDQQRLEQEAAADYYRQHICHADPILASLGLRHGLTSDVFSRMLKEYLKRPGIQLIPQPAQDAQHLETATKEAFARCQSAWNAVGQDTLAHYFANAEWAKGKHAKEEAVRSMASILDDCIRSGTSYRAIWDAIHFFSVSAIDKDTKVVKGKKVVRPPLQSVTPLFDACEQLVNLEKEYLLAHRLAFLQWAPEQLRIRKQQAKQQSYNDLIARLADALDGGSGEALANSVRGKYRAALIDEFQDTDPLQWKIFERIFGSDGAGISPWLFLIGDPKQAIYGFRGADVKTYVDAAATASHKYSLDTNWRSESVLVQAINTFFTNAGKDTVFVEDGIAFEAVNASGKTDLAPLTLNGERQPPLQVWSWVKDEGVTLGDANEKIPVAVAAEISRLLRDNYRLGGDLRLQPRDVAVLVESHKQARRIQSALHNLRIPSVELAAESVLESAEARELQWILMAIREPGREHLIKSALTTDVLGWSGDTLQAQTSQEIMWQARLQSFTAYRNSWEKDGFFFMFSLLLRQEQVIENLLHFADGERRITNLLHVAELLESARQAQHLNPVRLVQWLEERRGSDEAAPEDYQLRLESDEDAVRIVTIHVSKGLEYPVVFCPFLQKDGTVKKDAVLFHDAGGEKMVWDLSPTPDDAHQRNAERERLAENVRLLYVALTRARHRCYLVSASYKSRKVVQGHPALRATSLAWLLHASPTAKADPVGALDAVPLIQEDWQGQLRNLTRGPDGQACSPNIAVVDFPTEPGQPWQTEQTCTEELKARSYSRGEIRHAWYLSSFSLLASRIAFQQDPALLADQPDRDEAVSPTASLESDEQPAAAATGIFALPAGARTGECLHKILETFDFAAAADSAANDSLVKKQLAAYGFSEKNHAGSVTEMLGKLSRTPLDENNPKFTLAQISRAERLTELEFHFPTLYLDGASILHLIRSRDSGTAAPASPVNPIPGSRIESFLKGFIDLVFCFDDRYYILDWKSNHLGNRIEDYHKQAMQEAITESCYDLQYHLYTVALDKYLRMRLPDYEYEKHFGGVLYIFLRGISPDHPDLGIYRDHPKPQTIDRLSSLLGSFAGVKS